MINYRKIFLLFFLLLNVVVHGQTIKKVTVLWDVSHSMKDRDIAKEFYFLEVYFRDVQTAEVSLISFSDKVISKDIFMISDGDCSKIKQKVKTFNYDGATSYKGLEDYAVEGDVLLFTDGKLNADAGTPNFLGELYIINSKKDFDKANLNLLAIVNNGNLVNLAEKKDVFGKSVNALREYSGKIYSGVKGIHKAIIYVKGEDKKVESDEKGNFDIKGALGDTLVVSHENNVIEYVLGEDLVIDLSLKEKGVQLKEVVVTEDRVESNELITTAYGLENKDKIGYAVQSISSDDISDAATTVNNAAQGKFSGVRLGQNDDLSQITMRPSNSILGNNYGLIVIDGVPLPQSKTGFKGLGDVPRQASNDTSRSSDVRSTSFIDPRNIAEITVLKGLAATNRYGSMGSNGVLLITTKTAVYAKAKGEKPDMALLTDNIYDGKIKVNNKTLVTPYLKALKKGKNVQEAYTLYLDQRNNYWDSPEYLIDIYEFFYASNRQIAERILSNALEKKSPSYEELRTMFLKCNEKENHTMALLAANKMVEVFPNKLQSFLDLALANRDVGNYQEALNILNNMADGSANNRLDFSSLEKIMGTEIRNLVNKERGQLDISRVDKKYLNNLTYNARLLLDWNSPDAEFVVRFVNPQKRFFNWEHTEVSDRQRILSEINQGYTSEQFEIVGVDTRGDWLLNVTYLGNRTAGNKAPTFLKCKVQYDFGGLNQRNEEYLVRLHETNGEQQLAKFKIE